ncbi:MAG: hypothetical protein WAO24_06320 [Peptococcia bacterium]
MRLVYTFIILVIFILKAFLEASKLWHSKLYKDLAVYLSLWSLALLVAILFVYELRVISPAKAITNLLKPIIPSNPGP